MSQTILETSEYKSLIKDKVTLDALTNALLDGAGLGYKCLTFDEKRINHVMCSLLRTDYYFKLEELEMDQKARLKEIDNSKE